MSLVVGGAIFFGDEMTALAGALGVAGEGEDLGVVHQPVDHGSGDDVVGKGFTEVLKGFEFRAAALARLAECLVKARIRPATSGDTAFIAEMPRHVCVIEDWSLPDIDSEEVQELLPHNDVASEHQRTTEFGFSQ